MSSMIKPDISSLRFEGVNFAHEGQDPTLRSCDFEFPADKFVLLKSTEGAGKSTLLQLLGGLILPQSGSYLMNEENVIPMSFEDFLPYRLQIGFTFDYGGLISNRTIEDNLLLPLLYHKILEEDEARDRVMGLISKFEIGKFAKERPAHVPGRVRKLAVLLRGIVTHPQMLLLDDPSVGLGENTQELFAQELLEMQESKGLRHTFMSSYDEKFMSYLPHDIVHLDEGLLYHQPQQQTLKRVVNQ